MSDLEDMMKAKELDTKVQTEFAILQSGYSLAAQMMDNLTTKLGGKTDKNGNTGITPELIISFYLKLSRGIADGLRADLEAFKNAQEITKKLVEEPISKGN